MKLAFALLALSVVLSAENVPAAPILCTSNVPKRLCSLVESFFKLEQSGSSVLKDIQITIADRSSFQQEKDRLTAIWVNSSRLSPRKTESQRPLFISSEDDSILFEVGESKTRTVEKVVIASDILQDKNGDPDVDRSSETARYVQGYVEGCFYGRMHYTTGATER